MPGDLRVCWPLPFSAPGGTPVGGPSDLGIIFVPVGGPLRTTLISLALAALIPGVVNAGQVSAGTYKVRHGDTAASIAEARGLSLSQLQSFNPGVRLSKLSIGQSLVLAGKPKAPKTPAVRRAIPADHEVIHKDSQAVPVPSLPPTPGLGPDSLLHLERVLPAQTRLPMPENVPAAALLDVRGQDGASLAARMRPVLPPGSEEISAARSIPFEPADPDHLDLLWPVETRTISSSWGPRMRTRVVRVRQTAKKKRIRYRGSHRGIDLTAPIGTNVFATMDGEVVAVGRHRQYGNFVVVDHGNGVSTLYGHNRANFVEGGEVVRRGQKIAEVGRTGNATGPHLHFELRLGADRLNPLPFLNDAEEIPTELVAQNAAVAPASRR
jgi:murein DD-endopeptidase MepM/ murein hydrolase activator NlpD